METKRAFAKTLKKIRLDRGLTQETLALEAEISLAYMSEVERGLKEASITVMIRLCKVLRVKPHEFMKKMERSL